MPIPEKQSPVVRTTARERVFKTLQEWIINGTLLPEERLNDAELAKYFSVSRTPVREALQMLAEQKLVTMVPSSGTFVAPIDLHDLAYVYELLGILQANAIDLGRDRITEEELNALHQINQTFYHNARHGDARNTLHSDWEFHNRIAKLSGNPYLIAYTEQLMVQAHRNEIRFFESHAQFEQSHHSHEEIVDALRARDFDRAKEIIRNNWQVSMENDA